MVTITKPYGIFLPELQTFPFLALPNAISYVGEFLRAHEKPASSTPCCKHRHDAVAFISSHAIDSCLHPRQII